MPRFPTTPGWAGTRADAPVHVAFRGSDHVGTRDYLAFAAPWLAYALPYRRFAITLTSASARLGADADRYSFTVEDFHLLLFAGFDRRTEIQDFRKEFLPQLDQWVTLSIRYDRKSAEKPPPRLRPCQHLWPDT
jgi:hypothetical protein